MVSISGPDGEISAAIDPAGRVTVERCGERVIDPSPFGLETPDSQFPEAFDLVDTETWTVAFLDGDATATVTTDADGGAALTEYEVAVAPGETLSVDIAENGGFVVRF
ncbi:hypothetical protein HZS55_21915 [Halosimplex rubrum]|uniref:Uncharacterized protein n=1 Tax=Halosimplex rubrum TaxID=869889 RepID=A0A7D5T2F0_9EURY|nr:hypothetical protein [Halosimplex rubrum]QLH79788.1 hypothetical protein HZS55_21915 [Halosimplex rubrum]